MGISPSTLYKMQAEHQDVAEAIEGGRGMSVQDVENALARQAEADAEMARRVASGEMTVEELHAWRRSRAADAT